MLDENTALSIDRVLDTSGLQCPLPILKAKAELARMQAGSVLQVIATDRHAPIDFRVFWEQALPFPLLVLVSRHDQGTRCSGINSGRDCQSR